VKSKWSETEML